ncbi:MAG: hypothetical protein NTW95_01760 [Candidatus Aminicenantes bacterium]|nr:hypothetical protein [Candidatus Aminicenantes bacterium]
MNYKKAIIAASILALLLCQQLPAQKAGQADEKKASGPVYIAPQVAAVIDAGVAQRQNRSDIPLNYLRTLYLPAQQNQIYPIFLFKIKNADLNLAAAVETPGVLRAKFHAFIRVYRLENGVAGAIVRERYIPFNPEENQATFQPAGENFYSIAGEIYPAGNYLLALAVCTPDFAKISVVYSDFILPDVALLQNKLDTTPVYSVTGLQQMPVADSKIIIHKNSFVYNTLVMAPSISNEFKAGESLDLFYFILGAKADAANTYALQITYRFKKNGQDIRKLGPAAAKSIIVSQPIALSYSEITKDAKGVETERKEIKLEPGDYILEIEMLDNVSKAAGKQEYKFKVVL